MINLSILQTFESGNTRGEQPPHENIASTIICTDTVVFAVSITRFWTVHMFYEYIFVIYDGSSLSARFRPTASRIIISRVGDPTRFSLIAFVSVLSERRDISRNSTTARGHSSIFSFLRSGQPESVSLRGVPFVPVSSPSHRSLSFYYSYGYPTPTPLSFETRHRIESHTFA